MIASNQCSVALTLDTDDRIFPYVSGLINILQ